MSITRQTFKTMTIILFLLTMTVSLAAQEQGRIQIDGLSKLENQANQVVEVTLDGKILQLAVKALDAIKDPELKPVKEIVAGMKGIYVRVYQFDQPNVYTSADVATLPAPLEASP